MSSRFTGTTSLLHFTDGSAIVDSADGPSDVEITSSCKDISKEKNTNWMILKGGHAELEDFDELGDAGRGKVSQPTTEMRSVEVLQRPTHTGQKLRL